MNEVIKKKVYVGLSGGVDSSVSATLLLEQGFEVVGVFIKVWHPDFLDCTWKDDRRDAMRVCARLGIPFLELDLEEEYKKGVVDYMIEEYRRGRTPNPDVMCNRHVKFGGFYKWAIDNGADYVATGHYAQTTVNEDGTYSLVQGNDPIKDQTYFLWTLTSEQLAKTLFPIGHLPKAEVRRLAEKYNLHTASKNDSQGLCFIGHVDMKLFLKKFIETSEGKVLNSEGVTIGSHMGAELYTLGERHGFTIFDNSPNQRVLYVTEKDLKNNTITVGENFVNAAPKKNLLHISDITLTQSLSKHDSLSCKVRYQGAMIPVTVQSVNDTDITLSISLENDIVSPGQSVVLYRKNVCIGGGIIA